MSDLHFSPKQARVLAALVEKSITTPQYYPMTGNALVAACNQKNCRHPLMQLSEGEVGSALLDLLEMKLVGEDRGARVAKWRHRFTHHLLLKEAGQAVLITLMLRGPQTVSELRSNASSLRGPADMAGVEAVLADLADRGQPLVMLMERESGQKEARYAHLLCGVDAIPAPAASRSSASSADSGATTSRFEALEARLAALEEQIERLLDKA